MIARWLRAFRALAAHPWLWRHVPEWSDTDAAHLAAFFRTPAGAKLVARLRNASIEMNANAVANREPHANGVAYGLIVAIRFIESLSRPVPPQADDQSENGAQGSAGLDHLAP